MSLILYDKKLNVAFNYFDMKRIFLVLMFILMVLLCFAAKRPMSLMRAHYVYEWNSTKPDDGSTRHRKADMILQIGENESRFYSVKDQWLDSLTSTPEGRKQEQMMFERFIEQYTSGDKSARPPQYDVRIQVFKHHAKSKMDLFAGISIDNYTYTVGMNDIQWEIGDSVRTILGYECQQAMTDYHGRRWIVWFTPDIPIAEGPWQLHGLPGLIFEAVTDDGDHSFSINGIGEWSSPIEPIPGNKNYIKTDRMSYLRSLHKSCRGGGINEFNLLQMQYGEKTLPEVKRVLKHDFLETDYHEK